MNKKWLKQAGVLGLFVLGLLVMLYPWLADRYNAHREAGLITAYEQQLSVSPADKYEGELQAARAYNQGLVTEQLPDAFAIRDGRRDAAYEQLLNPMQDGMMGYVVIPAIGVRLPIYHYTDDEVLQKGAGHLFGSSLPVGGAGSHAVISAHRGLPQAKMFTDVNLLKAGDTFYLHVLGQVLCYEVDQILECLPNETQALAIEPGKDYVSLVTCTPYGVNSHRLLVRGHRAALLEGVSDSGEALAGGREADGIKRRYDVGHWLIQLGCVLLGMGVSGLLFWLGRLLRRRKSQSARRDSGG